MSSYRPPTFALLAALLLGQPGSGLANPPTAAAPPAIPWQVDLANVEAGRRVAATHCATCHLESAPGLLDRRTWFEQILPRMKVRVGLYPPEMASSDEISFMLKHAVIAPQPIMTEEEFTAVVDYYLARAPEAAWPAPPAPGIELGLKSFRLEPVRRRTATPSTTLVKILPGDGGRLLMGDDFTRTLAILDGQLAFREALALGNTPVAAKWSGGSLLLANIGSFQPAQTELAAITRWTRTGGAWQPQVLVTNLPRTTDVQEADLNGDGRPDLVVSVFGNLIGRLAWYEATEGGLREHRLLDKPGCLRTDIRDWNGDGRPDIMALFAQESEGLYLFLNDGDGEFTMREILRRHPLFGHSWFDVADLDADGRPDLLVTNGDNGEYASPLKNYHGVRAYLNRGGLKFEEAWFHPLNGAYRALARDFDLDGDLDVAAISFFPDYVSRPRESFVYFENHGGLKFSPWTFPECIAGRWLVMDAGDLDGDGDEDLALGSYIKGPSPVPGGLMETWQQRGPSAVVLRNTTREPQLGR
ncbi:MAG: FG-GAP-like repeat-containing protein [Limisphaerales bacterium]